MWFKWAHDNEGVDEDEEFILGKWVEEEVEVEEEEVCSRQALNSNWGVKQNYRISSANASIRVNDFGVLLRFVTKFTGAK